MKFFKNGVALLLPLALVVFVVQWLYNLSKGLVLLVLPLQEEWWIPIAGFFGMLVAIVLIGMIFHYITPLKWIYKSIERWIINKIPFVNKVYGFGKEVSDAFIIDVKEDGELTVVAVKDQFGGESIGVITNKTNNIIFIPTAPNPTNGFLTISPEEYRVVDTMDYADAIKFVTSIGKINGGKVK